MPVQAIATAAGAALLALSLACPTVGEPEPTPPEPTALVAPGRTLIYSGRSEHSAWRADGRPLLQRALTQTRLAVIPGPAHTWRADVLVLAADDDRALLHPSPYERREETLRVDPDTFEVAVERRLVRPRIAPGDWGPPVEARLSDDGFGLSLAARRSACLFVTGMPRAIFAELAAGRSVECPFDFHLVPGEPGADRVLVAADGQGAPVGAESRVRGRTTLSPLGREPFRVARRFLVPLPPDGEEPPEAGRPDETADLPALRVAVHMDLELERLVAVAGRPRLEKRRDDWTLTVLDRPEEPLILVAEGTIRVTDNPDTDPLTRTADATRRLEALEESRLDAPPPPP